MIGNGVLDQGRTANLTVFLTIWPPATIRSPSIETAIFGVSGRRFNSKGNAMSRRCDLTGKGVLVGHKVSHSNIKTKRRFLPNLLNVTMISDTLGRSVKLKVSANALKTVDHRSGLAAYLLSAKNDVLAPKMRDLKKAIEKKRAAS